MKCIPFYIQLFLTMYYNAQLAQICCVFLQLLLDAGAHVNAEDSESNTPLHVKCYGETNKPSEIECIEMLLNKKASLIIRNSRVGDINNNLALTCNTSFKF